MIQNYLKIALRNLRRHRAYTLLNLFGLGLSIACSILIFILIRHHLSFEQNHSKADRIVRLVTQVRLETVMPFTGVPNPLASALRTECPFLEKAGMYARRSEVLISIPETEGVPRKYLEEGKFAWIEPEMLDIFDLPLKQGAVQAFGEPGTAFITENLARKYFGDDAAAIGKTFRLSNATDLRVVGILQNRPANTDYPDEILAAWATRRTIPDDVESLQSWKGANGDTYCFALLKPGHAAQELQSMTSIFTYKYPRAEETIHFHYLVKPLRDLHFDTEYGATMDKRYIWALGFIGLFLLIAACVNFINMATAQALNRAREVGVRKSLGSTQRQLFWQFMFETGLIVASACVAGVIFASYALPYLNSWMKQSVQLGQAGFWSLGGFLLLLAVLLTVLAGAYPGLMQARFQPALSLKGDAGSIKAGGISIRRALVTVQFTISQILIIAAAVIIAQMHYARNIDWGFRPGTVVMLELPDNSKMKTLQHQLAALPGVKNVSLCYQAPASNSNNRTSIRYDNRPQAEPWIVNSKPADANYLETFGLQLVAGRNIQPSDTIREYLVNETFVRKLNLASPEEVLNKNIVMEGAPSPIVGVVRDFHHWGLSEPIAAIAIASHASSYSSCAVELRPGNPAPVLGQIRQVWESIYPDHFFESKFQEAQLEEFFESETLIFRLVSAFAGIAVFIGCLGLYGLAAFMVSRKRKEIGVRKTLGATVPGVLWLFGREYFRLILLAFVIAAPVAWWAMSSWLDNYIYRISVGAGIFLISLLTTFLIAALTVGAQSLRAALANPVQSLRNE